MAARDSAKILNASIGDPVGKAYPHLKFYRDEKGKMIGEVRPDSMYADSKFRSFSYASWDMSAKDSICMEFYDRVMRLW